MVEARLRWILPEPMVIDPAILATADRLGLSARVAELLIRRGVDGPSELEGFFAAPLAGLHDPRLLPDAAIVRDRIARARGSDERVLVFGDFDADGLTGLAIMTLALRRLGIAVEPYVPSRVDEGHGLSMAAVARAGELAATLIITVDCGSTSHAEIAAAQNAGIDVIVTDHHRVPPQPPAAFAIVNPHRPDATYPDKRLSGSAVAFKVAQLLLADEPGGTEAALDLTDLATIGGVADVAPVIGENRAIARFGLDRLRANARPGIAALLRSAGRDPANIDLGTVAFAIAPRLNAAGRVGEALVAAKLLLADDPAEADSLAETLETANRTRRDLTRIAIGEARIAVGLAKAATPEQMESGTTAGADGADGADRADIPLDTANLPPAIVVRGDWPVGIVGLVASRLAEDLARPAIVGANLGPVVRASCRSDGILDLAATLEACGDLFIRHGGHAGAAGFEIRADDWPAFSERFQLLAGAGAPVDPRPVVRVDLALPAVAVDYPLLRELANLGPCGPGNPDPVIAILGLTVTRVRAVTGGHTQLTLRRKRDVLDGIAFDRADLAETVREGDRVDVVGRIASRAFGGYESLQIEIRDLASSETDAEAAAVLALGRDAIDPIGSVA